MRKLSYFCAFVAIISLLPQVVHSQNVGINASNLDPHASAMLDVNSTDKGILVPRMTAAQKTAIAGPATGLFIFQTDGTAGFYYWNGTAWVAVSGGNGTVTSYSSGNLAPLFTTSVATATSTPALSFALSNAGAYTLLGNNTGANATPTYFMPQLASALFSNQGTTTGVLHGNAAGNPSWGQIVNADITNGTINLTTKVTGVLPIANGGTNTTETPTAGAVTYGTGTAQAYTAAGTAGQVLRSNGAGAPTWGDVVGTIASTGIGGGNIGNPLPTALGVWQQCGGYASVTLTATQRVTWTASVSLGKTVAGAIPFGIGAVYATSTGTGVVNVFGLNYMDTQTTFAAGERHIYTVSGTYKPNVAGTYRIGAGINCATGNYFDRNDYQNVTYFIVNE